jgi:hypothetical protein
MWWGRCPSRCLRTPRASSFGGNRMDSGAGCRTFGAALAATSPPSQRFAPGRRQSPRSSQTRTSPGSSDGSTCTMRGRQQTAQSSVYVCRSPPPESTERSSASPQKGHATSCGDFPRRAPLRFIATLRLATFAGRFHVQRRTPPGRQARTPSWGSRMPFRDGLGSLGTN